MKIEVRHITFSPYSGMPGGFSPLANICSKIEKDGWQLIRIIPHLQFESIAIFERLVAVEALEEEEGEGGKGDGYI